MIITQKKEVPDVTYEDPDDDRKLELYKEMNPIDPRDHGRLGVMFCTHKKYDLGDEQINVDDYSGWSEIREYLENEREAIVCLPLYLYDHSGLRIKVGSFSGQLPQGHARFDSGQVGFIYTTKERAENFGFEDKSEEELEKMLKDEVKEYDHYLSGNVYRYIYYEDGDREDSCTGFFGNPKEILGHIEEYIDAENIEEWDRDKYDRYH